MIICPQDNCSGCGACASICPVGSISIRPNQYGELHPSIDKHSCIECGSCYSVCPHNCPPGYHAPIECYAAWLTSKKERRECASGGVGTMLAGHCLDSKNGIVYGAIYNESLQPVIAPITTFEELAKFKGSKYVQCYISPIVFQSVKKSLDAGQFVAFFGTPCQIAGLQGYLGHQYSNLVTIDLICHGVSPAVYLEAEINQIVTRHSLIHVDNIRFRGNDPGTNYALTAWSNGKRVYKNKENPYLIGFLTGITLRECCASCPYARPDRLSDITIGDFIGLGESASFEYSTFNVSCVTVNTEKGLIFYKEAVEDNDEFISITRSYAERLQYAPSLLNPFPVHPQNKEFRNIYKESGYEQASRLVLKPIARRKKAARLASYSYRIPLKILRMARSKLRGIFVN